VAVTLVEFFERDAAPCYPRHSAIKLKSEGISVMFELLTPDLSASVYSASAPVDVYFSLLSSIGAYSTSVAEVSGAAANALVDEMRAFRRAAVTKRYVMAKAVVNNNRPEIDVSAKEMLCRTIGSEQDMFTSTDEVVGTQLTCDDFTAHCVKWLDDINPVENRGELRRNHIVIRGTDAEVVEAQELEEWFADKYQKAAIDARQVGEVVSAEIRTLVAEAGDEMYWRCLSPETGETIHVRIVDPSLDAISVPLFPEAAKPSSAE
jgi:hypothetical protein